MAMNWFLQNAPENSQYGSTAPVSGMQYGQLSQHPMLTGWNGESTVPNLPAIGGAEPKLFPQSKPGAQPQPSGDQTPYVVPGTDGQGNLLPGYHWEFNHIGLQVPVKDGESLPQIPGTFGPGPTVQQDPASVPPYQTWSGTAGAQGNASVPSGSTPSRGALAILASRGLLGSPAAQAAATGAGGLLGSRRAGPALLGGLGGFLGGLF